MTTFKTSYNRRSFLKVSAGASGGLLLGFSWLASCNPSPETVKALPKDWYRISAYLEIGENGLVKIYSPNPEIGQNVKTSMPMIVAEELDVPWQDVIVEQAALNTDWYTRQVAGGSQSIRQGWESLRMAGATARKLLMQAASAEWGVPLDTLSAADGRITNAKGETLTYGQVAAQAATLDLPTEATLKDPKDFKIIGQSKTNVDMKPIVTGKPLFGLDYKREGMKVATVLRPPGFGYTLESYDDSAARAVNGVVDVVRFEDKIGVIADHTWAAIKGKNALQAQWKAPKAADNSADHDRILTDLLDSGQGKPRRTDGDVAQAFAESDQVLERTYSAPFLPHNCMEPMNFFAHVTDEGADLVGPIQTPEWTRSRVATLLGYLTDDMDDIRRKAALEKVKINMTRMGGGFGRRLYGDFALEAAALSQLTKLPIKVVFTREDDMTAGTYRPASKYRIKAAIKAGKVTAYQLAEACINANMYGAIPNFFPAGAIKNYQVIDYQHTSPITIGAWRAPYTNFLASAEQSFLDELAEIMDKDAVALRLELLEAAKANYASVDKAYEAALAERQKAVDDALKAIEAAQASQQDPKPAEASLAEAQQALETLQNEVTQAKGEYEPQRMIDTIKLAADKGNWGKPAEGEFQGFSAYYSHNTYVAQVAHLRMVEGKPRLERVTCAVDCGIVVNPVAASNLVQGGVIDGIGHAMFGELTFEEGKPQASNFDRFRLIRMDEAPAVDVHFVERNVPPTGLGEPTLPPAGAALANAIYRATGKRLYQQPYAAQL